MQGNSHLAKIQRFLDEIAYINDQFANINWARHTRSSRSAEPAIRGRARRAISTRWTAGPRVAWVVDLIPLPEWRSAVQRNARFYFFLEPGVSSDANPLWEMEGGSPPLDTRAPEDVDRFVQMLEEVFADTAVRAWDVNLDRSSGSFATSAANTLLESGHNLYLLSFAAGA